MSENVLNFNVEDKVVRDLPFEPNPDTYNLVICGIDSVTKKELEVALVNKDGVASSSEYAGKKVPVFEIVFKTYPSAKTNLRERVLRVTDSVPYTIKKDGSAIDVADVNKNITNMFQRIKHLYDAYVSIPNYKKIEKLPSIDMDASIDKRIASFDKFFSAFEAAFNKGKDDKPVYRPAVGIPYQGYLKVLPEYSTKKWFTIPSFVNTGFFELVKIDSITKVPFSPNIKVGINESLELRAEKKGKADGAVNDSPDTASDDIQDILAKAGVKK